MSRRRRINTYKSRTSGLDEDVLGRLSSPNWYERFYGADDLPVGLDVRELVDVEKQLISHNTAKPNRQIGRIQRRAIKTIGTSALKYGNDDFTTAYNSLKQLNRPNLIWQASRFLLGLTFRKTVSERVGGFRSELDTITYPEEFIAKASK